MRAFAVAAVASFLAAACFTVSAQPAAKIFRIGIVLPYAADELLLKKANLQGPFEEAMRERGWIEGRNVEFLARASSGIDELVRLPVDVLVAVGGLRAR